MSETELTQFVQSAVNATSSGCAYALLASSFALTSRSGRFFHLAHGGIFVVGGYGALIGFTLVGVPGLALGIVAACAVGAATELVVYRPLRQRQASSLVLLLASLGVYLALQSAIALGFGNETKLLLPTSVRGTIRMPVGNLSTAQAITITLCAVTTVSLWGFSSFTRSGLSIRAVSADHELATVVGARTDLAVLHAMILGSIIVGATGIVAACDLDLVPTMGIRALLVSLAAAVIGGMRNPLRAALGGLALGFVEALTAWMFPARWHDVTMYALLAIILLMRPSRIFGLAVEKA